MGLFLLFLSAVAEACWNIFLKKSSGVGDWHMNLPGIGVLLCGIFTFKRALGFMPLSIAIVIWTGIQLILTITFDFFIFKTKLDFKVSLLLGVLVCLILALNYLTNLHPKEVMNKEKIEDNKRHQFAIIEAPSVLGLFPRGVETLPQALLEAGLARKLHARTDSLAQPPLYDAKINTATGILNPAGIASYTASLANAVETVLQAKEFPVILGGDCTILLATALALRRQGRYGLLFLDAHADFYQPSAEPSGEAASMELALATGHGPSIVTQFEKFNQLIKEEDVVHIGQRDAVLAEQDGSQSMLDFGIKVVDLKQIRKQGIEACIHNAVDHLTKAGLDGFFIHLDCDVLDDSVNPAVDYRIPGGLTFAELTTILRLAMNTGRAVAMEVTILNPKLDRDGIITRNVVDALVAGLL